MDGGASSTTIFLRLLYLELRKLLDTRASRWVLASMSLLALAIAGLAAGASSGVLKFSFVMGALQSPMTLAMAVIGILGMTGDWSHRVTTTYYPLVRSRSWIYVAKVGAAALMSGLLLVVLSLVSVLVLLTAKLVGNEIAFSGVGEALRVAGGATLLGTAFGLGVSAVIRRPTVSFVVVVLLSLGVNAAVLTTLPADVQPVFSTLTPLVLISGTNDGSVAGWQVLCSLTLWYVLPLVAGWWIARRVEA